MSFSQLTPPEITYLLRAIRTRLMDLSLGLHRYWLNRHNRSMTEQEMLPQLKEERSLLKSIRNKLWRMR